MRNLASSLAVAIAMLWLAPLAVARDLKQAGVKQAGVKPDGAKPKPAEGAKAWTPPRTADGQPDLQGVWANNSATPLQRPAALAGRAVLTDQEVAALKKGADQFFNVDRDGAFGDGVFEAALATMQNSRPSEAPPANGRDLVAGRYTGEKNQFWLPDRAFDNRTSLISDPPDGRIPPLTPEARARQAEAAARTRSSSGPEDRSLGERCITYGIPDVTAGYLSYYRIVQSPGNVAILTERIHDVRIIPLDGRPHINSGVQQWLGDSRGHWEGNTLVVQTRNFSPESNFRGAGQHLQLVERFTRVRPDTIAYEFTVTDPTTWVRPWTAMIPWKQAGENEDLFEFSCHEGNVSMSGILAGARVDEKKAAEAVKAPASKP